MRLRNFTLLLPVLCVSACAAPLPGLSAIKAPVEGVTAALKPEAPAVATALRVYRVGVGDELEIRLKGEGQLLAQVHVGADGRTVLPRAGERRVEGLSLLEIAGLIEADHGGGVEVRLTNARDVYVLGEVVRPGSLAYEGGLTLGRVLDRVGGLSHKADLKRVTIRPLHATGALSAGLDPDLPLMPGDVIEVPERFF